MNENLTLAQQTLCALIAKNLFGKQCANFENVNFADIYRESRLQAVHMLAFENLNGFTPDEQLKAKIEKDVSLGMMNNLANMRAHSHLHKLMTENKISYVILKGAASAHYYPGPILRNMGDVDFYVDPENTEKAKEVLIKDGFTVRDMKNDHHLVLQKKAARFELHFKITGIPNGKMKGEVERKLSGILEMAQMKQDEFCTFYAPSDFHHGLIMLMHIQSHFGNTGIGLRHVCDWAVFVNHFSEEEFVSLFEQPLKEIGLWKLAQTMGLVCSMYIGLARKSWMGDDIDTATMLAEQIFETGNFGRKNPVASMEGFFVLKPEKGKGKKGRIKSVFDSANNLVAIKWPIAKKIPLLYPFGWIFYAGRYGFRVMIGKRKKLKMGKLYKNSKKRSLLHERLEIYEINH